MSKILVASYCRVSTEGADQANSFESQCKYFSDYISQHDDWELFKVYADEGLSGTATEKRTAFKEMISDAENSCFALIITKEVSRFSRNILDTIYYTRKLKNNGVSVLFVNDGINTAEPDAELRLSIMASLAQEESRKTSSRVKWGQQRRMEQGVVFGRSMLGYDVHKGKIYVNKAGAEIISFIYEKYAIEKLSSKEICEQLALKGLTISQSHLIKILKNEKYAGDLIQKKTYTPDYLSHKKKYNHGQEDLVIIRDHHEAIVSRELWEKAQLEIGRRAKRHRVSTDPIKGMLFGKICCGECSSLMRAKKRRLKNGQMLYWFCPGAECDMKRWMRNDSVISMINNALQEIDFEEKPQLNEENTACLLDKLLVYSHNVTLKIKHFSHEWHFEI